MQKRIDLVKAVPLPRPLSLYVDPCNVCNYRCIFCPQSADRLDTQFCTKMEIQSFEKVVANIEELGQVKTLNLFSYGEPLLNSLTPEFLRLAKNHNISEKYVITTNASLLTPDKAKALVDNGLSFLRISIYGADTERYRERCGASANLERIIENIRFLKKYRDKTHGKLFIAVKMLDTGDEQENQAFIKKFSELGDECFIEPVHNWNYANRRYTNHLQYDEYTVCPYPFYTLVIHADLDVSVCCPDWNKSLCVGNLREQSLATIWKSDKLYEIQYALLAHDYDKIPICKDCSFYKINAGDNLNSLSADEFSMRRCRRYSS